MSTRILTGLHSSLQGRSEVEQVALPRTQGLYLGAEMYGAAIERLERAFDAGEPQLPYSCVNPASIPSGTIRGSGGEQTHAGVSSNDSRPCHPDPG